MNPLFQKALKKETQNCPPIWMMRQAGRYHQHYQKLRAKHEFMELCKVPELACEVALGPIQDFDFDVAILFSDLLFPLEAMGMGLTYEPGPKLAWHLNEKNIQELKPIEVALPQLHFQKEAMQLTRSRLPTHKSLVGFVGGPFTLFSYAVQGSHDGNLIETKKHLGLYPTFLEKLLPLLKANIQLQLEGGAEVVMLFDTSSGELSPALFHAHVVPAIQTLSEAFPKQLAYYSKGTHRSYLTHPFFASGKLAGLGVDHRWDFRLALELPNTGFIQGNFDQALLHMSASEFKFELQRWLAPLKELSPAQRAGWVCGLGHGVLPQTPEENVRYFVQEIRRVFS